MPTSIRIEKHLQCEKLLGLAGGNTKKHGNKKSGESRTPIRYNVMITYHSWQSIVNIVRSIHLPASMSPSYMDELCICPVLGEIITKLQHSTFRHYTYYNNYYSLHKIHNQWTLLHVPWTLPYHQCDRIDLWKTASEIIKLKHFAENVHVNYVVTDRSSALPGFLVSMLFGVSPANPSNFSHCIIRIESIHPCTWHTGPASRVFQLIQGLVAHRSVYLHHHRPLLWGVSLSGGGPTDLGCIAIPVHNEKQG